MPHTCHGKTNSIVHVFNAVTIINVCKHAQCLSNSTICPSWPLSSSCRTPAPCLRVCSHHICHTGLVVMTHKLQHTSKTSLYHGLSHQHKRTVHILYRSVCRISCQKFKVNCYMFSYCKPIIFCAPFIFAGK